MATKLTKKQQTQLTEKLTGIIQKNNALQLRLSADRSVNEMNVNQISGALNRIHGQAIGKDLPTEISIPVKQLGSGDPSPENIRPFVGYEIDGIGTFGGGTINLEEMSFTADYGYVTYTGVEEGWVWTPSYQQGSKTLDSPAFYNATLVTYYCDRLTPRANSQRINNAGNYASLISQGGSAAFSTPGQTLNAFKEYLGNNPVTFVYQLATPETYTLTPEQMIQLLDQL